MPSFARLLGICWTAVAGHRLRTHPYRQLLPDANFSTSRAQNRHFCALLPASSFPMAPPASNKPHSAEKSTPVWLAIWCTWAGFANSQLLHDAAALSSMEGPPRSGNSSAQTVDDHVLVNGRTRKRSAAGGSSFGKRLPKGAPSGSSCRQGAPSGSSKC